MGQVEAKWSLLPRPALRGVETSEARSESVGVRGCFRDGTERCVRGESPPHLKPSASTSPRIRLRPKVGFGGHGRGEVTRKATPSKIQRALTKASGTDRPGRGCPARA